MLELSDVSKGMGKGLRWVRIKALVGPVLGFCTNLYTWLLESVLRADKGNDEDLALDCGDKTEILAYELLLAIERVTMVDFGVVAIVVMVVIDGASVEVAIVAKVELCKFTEKLVSQWMESVDKQSRNKLMASWWIWNGNIEKHL